MQRVKNLFSDEETSINSEEHTTEPHVNKQIHARVAYQYPKKRNFRFPVIPDEPVVKGKIEKTDIDTPAYQRREQQSFVNNQTKSGIEGKHEEKRNKEPFKVTEIPSPVDGFLKKQTAKDLDNIPAFLRKESANERQIAENDDLREEAPAVHAALNGQLASTLEKTEESPADQKSVLEQKQVIKQKNKKCSELMQKEGGHSENVIENENKDVSSQKLHKKENESNENFAATTVGNESSIRSANKSSQEQAVKRKDRRHLGDRKKHQSTPQIPFNVLMTPADRINSQIAHKGKESSTSYVQGTSNSGTEQRKMSEAAVPKERKLDLFVPNHLLNDPVPKSDNNRLWLEEQQRLLEETLKHFHVKASVVRATQGPAVTRFEVHPELGVKVSKIKNLSDDLKLNMKAKDIRIEAPIPGKNTVGIEVPNPKARMVGLQEIFETEEFQSSTSPLTIALGLSIEGKPKITNIQKMPHGLIAGATGSGKSVCINTLLISMLYKASYEEVKFLLIDPKMVELAPYNGIPHLVAPVITDVKAATQSLKWAVNEMEERYEKFVQEGVRNIEGYNRKMVQQHREEEKMPFIVIVIDELADLMMTSPHDVEESISRIAQKARACGIHLILATQRPSVDVITGLIKANIPTRIAFSVSSQVDSRTIIDVSGAEKLLGKGDMLFLENGTGKTVRLQGPFVSDEEIERVTNYVRTLAEPNYLFEQEDLLEQVTIDEEEDELLADVIDFVIEQNSASTSLLQRRFKIGYNRAARLMDSLEHRGIISGQNGSKPREVLVSKPYENEIK